MPHPGDHEQSDPPTTTRPIPVRPFAWLRVTLQLGFLALLTIWSFNLKPPAVVFSIALPFCAVAAWFGLRHAQRLPRGRAFRRGLRFVDVALINVILLLAGAEIGVRVLGQVTDSVLVMPLDYKSDKQIRRFRGRPGAKHCGAAFNDLGFFDEPFVKERRPGVRRIAAFGDSFGVGLVHYDDNFLTRVDRDLDAFGETEVMNFSVVCVGIREYAYLYRTVAADFQPDEVLVCMFLGNDVMDGRLPAPPLHRNWFRLTHVSRRLRAMIRERDASFGFSGGPLPKEDESTVSEASYLETERKRAEICRAPLTADLRTAYDTSLGWLGTLHDAVGDRLRVVLMPDEFQVSDDLWARLALGSGFDRDQPNRLVRAFLTKRNIAHLDLLAPLRAAERTERTYKPNDSHWNKRGNAVAAHEIVQWLRTLPRP